MKANINHALWRSKRMISDVWNAKRNQAGFEQYLRVEYGVDNPKGLKPKDIQRFL